MQRIKKLNSMKKPSHDKDVILYQSHFVAWFHYNRQARSLLVVMRDGKAYQFQKVPVKAADTLMQAANKGSYLYHNIMKVYTGKKLETIVPAAILEQKLTPPAVNRWLSQ